MACLNLVRLSGSAAELQELEMLDVACGAGGGCGTHG